MKRRHLLVPLVSLGVLALALEACARHQDLDALQAMSVSYLGADTRSVGRSGSSGEPLGVAYLPRGFVLDDDGFTTVWGRCSYDHAGPSVLVLGDSTTRAGTPSATDPFRALSTWPRMLDLAPDVQVCVLAEDGYHPSDLADIYQALSPRTDWDLVVALLCHNDARPTEQRMALRGDPGALYHPPPYRLAWAPLWVPWLFEASEAFRFAHWRLALSDPSPLRIPEPSPQLLVAPSLTILASSPLRIFYLPTLGHHPSGPDPQRHLEAMTERLGLWLHVVDLPAAPETWRQAPDDVVHLNRDGHAGVAAEIQEALAADPALQALFRP